MRILRKKAAAPTAARNKIVNRRTPYTQNRTQSTENFRAERIRKHRADIPRIHRKTYDRAIQGKSLKSAVKSFCLECCCWRKEEVRLCTSLDCPLYLYRPYKEKSKQASDEAGFSAESKNSGKGGKYAG